MIASLMMYARPELEGAHERLWTSIRAGLAARGITAPESLSQTDDEFSVWEDPTLVLSQTCGMPYRTRLHGRVQIVGTPDYGLKGCAAGYYRSAIVVHRDDPRRGLHDYCDARFAYNMAHSHSGFAAMFTHAVPLGFWFANRVHSGSHLRSVRMVASGRADIASIDAQTWRLFTRYEPMAVQLRVLEYTSPTPGLPYITGPTQNADLIYDAVDEAISGLAKPDANTLGLRGLTRINPAEYLAVQNPPDAATL